MLYIEYMSGYTKKNIEEYTKAMLPVIKAVAATDDLNERLLILAEYGHVSGVINELLAAVTFSNSKEETETAIRLVEEGLADLIASNGTELSGYDFTGFTDDEGGIPSA